MKEKKTGQDQVIKKLLIGFLLLPYLSIANGDCDTCAQEQYLKAHGVTIPKEVGDIRMVAIQKGLESYSNDPRTISAISTIEKNASKCLRAQTLRGVNVCRGAGYKKSERKSIGLCGKYVKHGLWEKNPKHVTGGYPNGEYAVDSAEWLKPAGFIDITKVEGFRNMTPSTAPKGAVLVYRNTQKKTGRPGHIEIKLDNGKFGSDHINTRAISDYHPHRELIGIYVKLPAELERSL